MRGLLPLAFVVACGSSGADQNGGADAADAGFDVTPIPPTQITTGTGGYESEDQIAVAPDGTIGIVWTAFSTTQIRMGYVFSTDDGQTFSAPQYISVPAGLSPIDPAINVDSAGNFYAAMLGVHYTGQTADAASVYATAAPAGSLAFGAVSKVSDSSQTIVADHPKIFVTQAGTILVGYASYTSLQASSGLGIVASSTDGQTWAHTTVVSSPSVFANFFWFCEGAAIVYTTFYDAVNANFIDIAQSTDDGVTWSPTFVHASGTDKPAAIDPACVASGDDVWVMYATTNVPPPPATSLAIAKGIRIVHSGNRGVTFTPPTDVLDTTQSTEALLPVLARETSGTLDVAYIGGNVLNDPNGSVFYVRASDAGVAPAVAVDGPVKFTTDRATTSWIGDYMGMAWHAGGLYLAYPRNDTGYDHIYFAKVAL